MGLQKRAGRFIEWLEPRRLFSAITLDPHFGTNGFLNGPIPDQSQFATFENSDHSYTLAVQYQPVEGGDVSYIGLSRLRENGSLDRTFGRNGKAMYEFDGYGALLARQQSDGKIAVLMRQDSVTGNFARVVRFNPDGTLDATFGTGGICDFGYPNAAGFGNWDLAVAPNGTMIGIGPAAPAVLFRITADGHLDHTFGTGGFASPDPDMSAYDSVQLTIQPDNKIIVGAANSITRLTEKGRRDPTFFNKFGIVTNLRGRVLVAADGTLFIATSSRETDENTLWHIDPSSGTTLYATVLDGQGGGITELYPGGKGKLLFLSGTTLMRLKPGGAVDDDFNDIGFKDFADESVHSISHFFIDRRGRFTVESGTIDDGSPTPAPFALARSADRPPLELSPGGTLFITTGDDADIIALRAATENRVRLSVNGVVTYYHANAIIKIDISSGGGDDRVTCSADIKCVINAGGGNNFVAAGDQDDRLMGGTGNDTIYGSGGMDTIYGGSGNDALYAGDNGATIYGGAGNDLINSVNGTRADVINGGDGIDSLQGDDFDFSFSKNIEVEL